MTHKYQWAEDLVKDLVPVFGDKVTIESPSFTVNGQDQPKAYLRYDSPAMIPEKFKSLNDRQKKGSRARVLLPVTQHRAPVPGDTFIVDDKRYIAETVSYLAPANVNVAYEVYLSDR